MFEVREARRKELIDVLEALSSGIADKELIEQTNSYVFLNNQAYTFNDEIAVSIPFDCGFNGAVPSREFLSFLRKAKTDTVKITATDSELQIKSGRATAGIRLEAEIKLPIDTIKIPEKWKKLPANFCDGITACLPAISKDSNKPLLMCLYIKDNFIWATDNYRITQFTLDGSVGNASLLMLGSSAKELISANPNSFNISQGWLHFKNKKGLVFSCRYFDDDFPDLSKLINKKGKGVVFPTKISEMLERASSIAGKTRVQITITGEKVKVESKGELGWFSETAKAVSEIEGISFEIEHDFLMSILKKDADVKLTDNTIDFYTDNYVHVVRFFPLK